MYDKIGFFLGFFVKVNGWGGGGVFFLTFPSFWVFLYLKAVYVRKVKRVFPWERTHMMMCNNDTYDDDGRPPNTTTLSNNNKRETNSSSPLFLERLKQRDLESTHHYVPPSLKKKEHAGYKGMAAE
jgi:hypothetical protein